MSNTEALCETVVGRHAVDVLPAPLPLVRFLDKMSKSSGRASPGAIRTPRRHEGTCRCAVAAASFTPAVRPSAVVELRRGTTTLIGDVRDGIRRRRRAAYRERASRNGRVRVEAEGAVGLFLRDVRRSGFGGGFPLIQSRREREIRGALISGGIVTRARGRVGSQPLKFRAGLVPES